MDPRSEAGEIAKTLVLLPHAFEEGRDVVLFLHFRNMERDNVQSSYSVNGACDLELQTRLILRKTVLAT